LPSIAIRLLDRGARREKPWWLSASLFRTWRGLVFLGTRAKPKTKLLMMQRLADEQAAEHLPIKVLTRSRSSLFLELRLNLFVWLSWLIDGWQKNEN